MKKIALLLGIFFFTFSSTSFAVTPDLAEEGGTETPNGGNCSPALDEETFKNIEDYQEKEASLQESYTLDVVTGLFDIAGVNSLGNLILGNPYCLWTDKKDVKLVYGIFTEKEKEKVINPIVSLFQGTFLFVLMLAIMISCLRLAYGNILGRGMGQIYEDIYSWFLAIFFLVMYPEIVDFIFMFNDVFVSALRDILDEAGLDYKSLSLLSSKDEFNFTDVFVLIAEGLLAMYLNLVYIFRKVFIFILLMLGPLAGMSLMFPRVRAFFSTWLKEIVGVVFLQSVHALLIFIFIQISQMLPGEGGIFMKMGMLLFFLPVTSMVLGWLKLSESAKMSAVMAGTAISSIGAVAQSVQGQLRDKPKSKDSNESLNLAKNENNRTKISSTASGEHSKGWASTKKAVGVTGATVGGLAGAVAGPMGARFGSGLGGSLSKGILQGSRNVAAGGLGVKDSIKSAKGNHGFRNSMKNIQTRRDFFGNMGESVGSVFGKGELGRSVGHGLSGVSRQRLANSSENGGLGGLSLSNLSQLIPGGGIHWIQNNQGSAFYRSNGEEMERISPLGAADTSLRNGENRMVDFRLNGQNPLNAQSNGVYEANRNMDQGINTSSPYLSRTSDAYLMGASGDHIQDTRFDPSSIQPDSYYKAGLNGAETRGGSDHVADIIGGQRHRGFS